MSLNTTGILPSSLIICLQEEASGLKMWLLKYVSNQLPCYVFFSITERKNIAVRGKL